MPGSVANVLLMPQITSAYFGAMSKQFGEAGHRARRGARRAAHDQDGRQRRRGLGQQQQEHGTATERDGLHQLADVAGAGPCCSIRSAHAPATFAATKLTSDGAADRTPALASETPNVLLK